MYCYKYFTIVQAEYSLRSETVLVPGIADQKPTVQRETGRMCRVQSDFLSPLEMYKYWRLGRGAHLFLSAVLTVCCSLLMSLDVS